jgi:hypothetical protein
MFEPKHLLNLSINLLAARGMHVSNFSLSSDALWLGYLKNLVREKRADATVGRESHFSAVTHIVRPNPKILGGGIWPRQVLDSTVPCSPRYQRRVT